MREYNACCQPGKSTPLELDGLATRGLAPEKSNWATPIDEAPFHAYPIISSNVFTFGGLKIDTSTRVLDIDDAPIPGLFAAGELVGGLYYFNYPGSSGLMSGAVFGRIAGAEAAAYVAQPR